MKMLHDAAPSVTVVVATRGRGEMIAGVLEGLLRESYPRLQVVVVDQSIDDLTEQTVRRLSGTDGRFEYRRTDTVGVSAGRNLGIEMARGEIVAFSDDDCLIEPGWVRALVAEFADPTVVAVFGRVLPSEARDRDGTEVCFKPDPERVVHRRRVAPWYVGHGANMGFRRAALEEIGGFDPFLGAGTSFGGFDDCDVVDRLLARGQCIVYSPSAVVYHQQGRSWAARRRTERAYGMGAGAAAAKCLRCGDAWGLSFLSTWIWQLGVRRVGAGILKWRSVKVTYLGYCQLVYPFLGFVESFRLGVDPGRRLYVGAAPLPRLATPPDRQTAPIERGRSRSG
jgi:GT2 family glycosyltransferase